MKKCAAVLLVLVLCSGIACAEVETDTDAMAVNFGRGFVNLLTGWLEIPRATLVDGGSMPYGIGVPVGLIGGSMLTVARGFSGLSDILTVGMLESPFYKMQPDYVWQAPWSPPKEEEE